MAQKYGAKYLVSSTSECYGDPLEHPQKETYWGNVNPIGPRSVYDEAKRFTEAVTMAYHRYHKVDTRIVRIFNTYGPRMQLNDGRVVPNFMKQALRGEGLTVYGDGSQTRSFCYVSDEVDGFLRLSKSAEHVPVNIGNPTEFTILECAQRVLAVTGSKSTIRYEACPRTIPSSAARTSPRPGACWDGSRRLIWRMGCGCRWIIFVGRWRQWRGVECADFREFRKQTSGAEAPFLCGCGRARLKPCPSLSCSDWTTVVVLFHFSCFDRTAEGVLRFLFLPCGDRWACGDGSAVRRPQRSAEVLRFAQDDNLILSGSRGLAGWVRCFRSRRAGG